MLSFFASLPARHYTFGKISNASTTAICLLCAKCCSYLHKQSDNFNETTVSKVSRIESAAQKTAVTPTTRTSYLKIFPQTFITFHLDIMKGINTGGD